jgi:hypothetical protein
MKQNSKMMFTMAVLTFLMLQHLPKGAQATEAGGILGGGSLVDLNLNLCLFRTVGQFKTYCAEDYLNILDLKAYLTNIFPNCFPNGIILGNPLGLHVDLTVLEAVNVFLALNGTAGVLTVSATNPADCAGGVLAREILVLTINLAIDAFNPYWCLSSLPLAELVLSQGPCSGLSVAQVLALAHSVLSGGPCPPGLSLDILVNVLVQINVNFRAGLINHLYLAIPKLIAVNVNLAC